MDEIGIMRLLQGMGGGRVLDDLHDRLQKLLVAARTSHDKGKVVLTITVEPDADREIFQVNIHGDVTATIPHIKRTGDRFYLTDEGRLTKRNPRQPEMPANTVQMPPPEERNDLDGKSQAAGERS